MSKLPKYIMSDTSGGLVRYYFRRGGYKIRIREKLGTPEFECAMAEASGKVSAFAIPRRNGPDNRFVYFIRFGTKKVKIGSAKNVHARFSELKVGIPGKARIYYVTLGGATLERELHKLFREDRLNGEWFIFSKAIREWIEADEQKRLATRAATGQIRRPRFFPTAPRGKNNKELNGLDGQ